eukprot:2991891-Rhodomonas_salina.2
MQCQATDLKVHIPVMCLPLSVPLCSVLLIALPYLLASPLARQLTRCEKCQRQRDRETEIERE